MFKSIIKGIFKHRTSVNISYLLFALIVLIITLNAYFAYEDFILKNSDPFYTISLLLANLVTILIFCIFTISKRLSSISLFFRSGKRRVSKLRKRIIIAFSIGAALPTIIVAVFSTYFFT